MSFVLTILGVQYAESRPSPQCSADAREPARLDRMPQLLQCQPDGSVFRPREIAICAAAAVGYDALWPLSEG